eukprot:5530634-Amphidinium_carterae.1
MSAPKPHPEPGTVLPPHIHYFSLPLHCGVIPLPGSRTYVVWRISSCADGPYAFAGIHTGSDSIAWKGLQTIIGQEGYRRGACHLRQVDREGARNILVEAEKLFRREAAQNRVPSDIPLRLFLWYSKDTSQQTSQRTSSASQRSE